MSPQHDTGSAVEVGAEVTPLQRTITQTDMVAYAGATWDWHRMHYDTAYATAAGFPATVVDGQVLGALLAEQLQDHFGPRAVLQSLHFRFKNLVFAGETVRCTSRVVAAELAAAGGGDLVTVESTVEVVGQDPRVAVVPAGATVLVRR